MTTWRRAARLTFCGGCPRQISPGEPMLVWSIAGITRQFIRCETCAGEAPPDLPPLVESPRTKRMEPVKRIAARAMPFDWKVAAAGREPGCDEP